MATSAKGNQVQVVIIALLTAQSLVMHMQILSGTADLASPAITAENLFSE
jgi:hypothetical protein